MYPGRIFFTKYYIIAQDSIIQYTKHSLTITDQLNQLENRGMDLDNSQEASIFLEFVSYYRLSGYWKSFEQPNTNKHIFQENIRFGDVKRLYEFDRKLRLLLLDAIERIEIALRTQWTNYIAQKYGPRGYLNEANYKNKLFHEKNVSDLRTVFEHSRDEFVIHYRRTYIDFNLLPVWMATELMSFGLLSRFFSNMKCRRNENPIAGRFRLEHRVFTKFMYHLSFIRNVCAHHGRLWDRDIFVSYSLPSTPEVLAEAFSGNNRNGSEGMKLYNTLVMIDHLFGFIIPYNEEGEWKGKLIHLINCNSQIDLSCMGFPDDWRDRLIWRVK